MIANYQPCITSDFFIGTRRRTVVIKHVFLRLASHPDVWLSFRYSSSPYIMSIFDPLNIGIAVAGLVLTAYIAYRQDAFSSHKILVTPGGHIDYDKICQSVYGRGKRPLWGVVIRIPNSDFDTAVFYVPLLIQNTGTKPLKNIAISLRYSKDLNCTDWSDQNKGRFSHKTKEDIIFNTKTQSDDVANSVYTAISIPSVQPRAGLIHAEPLAITSATFKLNEVILQSERINSFFVEGRVVSDSLKDVIPFNFRLILIRASTQKDFISTGENHILNLLKDEHRGQTNQPPKGNDLLKNKFMVRYPSFKSVLNVPTQDCSEDVKNLAGAYGGFHGLDATKASPAFELFVTKDQYHVSTGRTIVS